MWDHHGAKSVEIRKMECHAEEREDFVEKVQYVNGMICVKSHWDDIKMSR